MGEEEGREAVWRESFSRQTAASVLRLSLGEWCRRSLLCVHIALISSLRAAAGGVLPLGPPGGGEVLLVPNSGLEGDDVLVSVRFFLVDILHALGGSEILETVELEAHGEDGTFVVPSAVDTLVLAAGVQFLPVPGAYALPVSLCDGVAALKGESESGKLGDWGEWRVEVFYALFVASTPLG